MKLLLVADCEKEAQHIVKDLFKNELNTNLNNQLFGKDKQAVYKTEYANIQLTLLVANKSTIAISAQLGKLLSIEKYHLVLSIGLAKSYKSEYTLGQLVSVINDKQADWGEINENEITNGYDLNWDNNKQFPYQRGGLINLTNAYFNVFLPIEKAMAITVSNACNSEDEYKRRLALYNAYTESITGAAIAYTCLFNRQPFYQLRWIEHNLATNQKDESLALQKMQTDLIHLLDKLD